MKHISGKCWVVVNALLVVALFTVLGVHVVDAPYPGQGGGLSLGTSKKVIRIGHVVDAAGDLDFTFDGADDNVQFQAALALLPATGGRIVVVSAVDINWAAATTVTRAIPNVIIEGAGLGTRFIGDGATAMFTAGGNGWQFVDASFNAGSGPDMAATTNWSWERVQVGTTLYSHRSPYGQSIFNDITAASVTDSGLTSGRVPYATTGGLLTDSSNVTVVNDTLVATTANITTLNTLAFNLPTGRGATYVFAAQNATAEEKSQANQVLTGTNDYIAIQAVLDTMTSGQTLRFLGPVVSIGSVGINLTADYFTFDAISTQFYWYGTGTMLSWNGSANSNNRNVLRIGKVLAAGAAAASENATAVTLSKWNSGYIDILSDNFLAGQALELLTVTGTSSWVEANDIFLSARVTKRAVKISGNDSVAYNRFWKLQHEQYTIPGATTIDTSNYTGTLAVGVKFRDMHVWMTANVTSYGVNGNALKTSTFDRVTIDGQSGNGGGFILFNNADSTLEASRVDLYGTNTNITLRSPTSVHPRIGPVTLNEITQVDSRARFEEVLTQNSLYSYPMVADNFNFTGVNGTAAAGTRGDGIYVRTGTTNWSAGMAYTNSALSFGQAEWFRYTQDHAFQFDLAISGADTNCTGYVHLKAATSFGDLGADGLGIFVSDNAVWGETHDGAGLSIVDLSTVMDDTNAYTKRFTIIYRAGVSVEFYVDGVLKGTLTVAAADHIPNSGFAPVFSAAATNGGSVTGTNFYMNVYGLNSVPNFQ